MAPPVSCAPPTDHYRDDPGRTAGKTVSKNVSKGLVKVLVRVVSVLCLISLKNVALFRQKRRLRRPIPTLASKLKRFRVKVTLNLQIGILLD